MKVLQEQYNLIKEGKGNKAHFLKTAFRLFPDMLSPVNTYEDTVHILKNRSIISEGIGGVVTAGKTPDWHQIFKENITEAAKAEEKEATKEVTDMETKGYDYKDKKNYDNVFGEEFLKGFYTEMGDSKNEGKTVDELKQIVAKNLAKDCNYYVKDGQFGLKGVGYETEVPGLGTPKEAKGKFKSSGYGDLKENRDPKAETSFYNSLKIGDKAIYNGPEKNGFQKGDEVEIVSYISNSTFQKTLTVKKGNKKLIVKGHGSLKPLNESYSPSSLKESVLRAFISEIVKEALAEAKPASEDDEKKKKEAEELNKEFKKRLATGDLDEGIHDKDITSASHTNVKTPPKGVGDYDPQQRAASLKRLANMGPKPKNTDEALKPEDEEMFTKATDVAEKLYDKLGSVKAALAKIPAEYASFKDELEQHLTQKFEG